MSVLFISYLTELRQYAYLQKQLHDLVEVLYTVTPLKEYDYGFDFPPIQSSILKQIKVWPLDAFCYPPSGWVQPRKGQIMFDDIIWKYAFHGAGLSFFNTLTNHDVSIEYTRTGESGITDWTTRLYLEQPAFGEHDAQKLLAEHPYLFTKAITDGYLVETPPLLGQGYDDQTYVFSSRIYDVEI